MYKRQGVFGVLVRALEISIEAHTEGPKMFGVDIMAGEGIIGENYADVH